MVLSQFNGRDPLINAGAAQMLADALNDPIIGPMVKLMHQDPTYLVDLDVMSAKAAEQSAGEFWRWDKNGKASGLPSNKCELRINKKLGRRNASGLKTARKPTLFHVMGHAWHNYLEAQGEIPILPSGAMALVWENAARGLGPYSFVHQSR
jgi:hypothetical protein